MKSLLEKDVPVKIYDRDGKYIIALNFDKPIGKKNEQIKNIKIT